MSSEAEETLLGLVWMVWLVDGGELISWCAGRELCSGTVVVAGMPLWAWVVSLRVALGMPMSGVLRGSYV